MFGKLTRIMSLVLLVGVLNAPLAQASTRVYVQIGPPVAVVETRPVVPSPDHV